MTTTTEQTAEHRMACPSWCTAGEACQHWDPYTVIEDGLTMVRYHQHVPDVGASPLGGYIAATQHIHVDKGVLPVEPAEFYPQEVGIPVDHAMNADQLDAYIEYLTRVRDELRRING